MDVGRVHGGATPNRSCGGAELHIDWRLVPGMQPAAMLEELDVCLRRALDSSGCTFSRRTLFDGISAFETPANSHMVRTVERLAGAPSQAVSFGTEAPFFSGMGMETIVIGPGRISQAHQPNEYVEHASLAAGETLLEELVSELTA